MATQVFAVAATEVEERPATTWWFIIKSEAPDEARFTNNVGTLLLKGQPRAVGDDDTPRWYISVRNGSQRLLDSGVDQSDDEEGLALMLRHDVPDAVVLTTQDALPRLQLACEKAGVKFGSFLYDGSLATS